MDGIPSSLSCRGGVGGFVEFVVGATVGKGNGVVYLAMARDTGGLKDHISQTLSIFIPYLEYFKKYFQSSRDIVNR